MGQLKLYAIIALLVFSVISGGTIKYLWNKNNELKQEVNMLEVSIEKSKENLKLLTTQLENEELIRKQTEQTFTELRKIPDVDYQTPLPPSISNVLTDFSNRLQQK